MDPRDRELLDRMRLHLVPGLGPRLHQSLLDGFGSATAILSAPRNRLLGVSGVGQRLADAIRSAPGDRAVDEELDRCRRAGIAVVAPGDPDYPVLLAEICDPPAVLYRRGDWQEGDQLAVAIVGSRRCTTYGRRMADRLAGGLARAGVTIISGLARGIDAVAHRAALEAGGRTVAVLAGGLARLYPPEHAPLADQVARQGCLVTESRLDQRPLPGLFPQRNRIISGLSLGVVVVEAGSRSGALHTARHAAEQGREVLAVPGQADSPASRGCLGLIRDGARLVLGVDDVLEELVPLTTPVSDSEGHEVHSPRELVLNDRERQVLDLIALDPRHLDQLLRTSPLDDAATLSTLTVLEMRRLVTRLPGSYLIRSGG